MIGVRVADYQVVGALGGTAGAVYRATHAETGRDVVLKFLPEGVSGDAYVVERFRCQAEALAAIHHPNVATVLGPGSSTHRHYVALEFVEGSTLEQVIAAEGPLPPERALPLVKGIASGLAALHEAGLVHGNVQPANVIVGADDAVTLVGLGLARQPRPEDAPIRTDPLGVRLPPHPPEDSTAPAYYPPEVGRGRPLDARSDLYQLGGTLYHMLAGGPPFEAESEEHLALRHIREDVPSIDQSLRTAPVLLCRLLDRLLLRDPDARYQSAAEVIEAADRVESMLARTAEAERKAAEERKAAADRRAAERAREQRARRKGTDRKRPERAERDPDETAYRPRRKPHRPWLKPALFGGVCVLLVAGIAALLLTGGGKDRGAKQAALPKNIADEIAAGKAMAEGTTVPIVSEPKAPAKPEPKPAAKPRKDAPAIRGHCRTATTDLGGQARYEHGKDCIGFWVDDSMVYWEVDVPRNGVYEAEIQYAAAPEADGNIIEIALGDEKIQVPIKATGSWEKFVTVGAAGRLKATEGSKRMLCVRPIKKPKGKGLINLRLVTLRWVADAPEE